MSKSNEVVEDEVDAMRHVAVALKGLDPDAIKRVLQWANDRYEYSGPARPISTIDSHGRTSEQTKAISDTGGPSEPPTDLGELYALASPETEAERALVVAFWIQSIRGDADFDAQSVNNELKHLGDGVGNITQAFTKLIAQKPQLVIQTRKQGSSRQARKRYKVTSAGIRAVHGLLTKGGGT